MSGSRVVQDLGTPGTVRLYRVAGLAVPVVPGRGRLVTAADHAVLVEWHAAFAAEVALDDPRGDQPAPGRPGTVRGEAAGAPASFAGLSPASGGACRIGPVYTPPAARGRGCGAAVMAYASQVAPAERRREAVLFTDPAYPMSDAVYRTIGFRPVGDHALVMFAG
ncbi:GNAT family N-acetyltransferase [Nonomuraea muscovyensis]|uniref:GNAT family N-acetyltransferase n=1 Tax=Nonomuraea muscovyensis TaxID=1124761 RepID=UPI003405270D